LAFIFFYRAHIKLVLYQTSIVYNEIFYDISVTESEMRGYLFGEK